MSQPKSVGASQTAAAAGPLLVPRLEHSQAAAACHFRQPSYPDWWAGPWWVISVPPLVQQ